MKKILFAVGLTMVLALPVCAQEGEAPAGFDKCEVCYELSKEYSQCMATGIYCPNVLQAMLDLDCLAPWMKHSCTVWRDMKKDLEENVGGWID